VSAPRKFDYEAARVLRAAGWSYPRIGKALGVSHCSVMYACDDYYRRRHIKAVRARVEETRRRKARRIQWTPTAGRELL
jgi:hypothetical protein